MFTTQLSYIRSMPVQDLKFCDCCHAFRFAENVTNYDNMINVCLDCLVDKKLNVVNDIAALYADGDEPIPYGEINKWIHEKTEYLSKP